MPRSVSSVDGAEQRQAPCSPDHRSATGDPFDDEADVGAHRPGRGASSARAYAPRTAWLIGGDVAVGVGVDGPSDPDDDLGPSGVVAEAPSSRSRTCSPRSERHLTPSRSVGAGSRGRARRLGRPARRDQALDVPEQREADGGEGASPSTRAPRRWWRSVGGAAHRLAVGRRGVLGGRLAPGQPCASSNSTPAVAANSIRPHPAPRHPTPGLPPTPRSVPSRHAG